MPKRPFEDDMGLSTWDEGALVWSMKSGRLRWAPLWLKRAIVKIWNPIHCMIHGHNTSEVQDYKDPELRKFYKYEGPRCVNCTAELPVDGRYIPAKQRPLRRKKPQDPIG